MNAQHRGEFIAYYRVGADSQGRRLTEECQRPKLVKALAACRQLRARLVIAIGFRAIWPSLPRRCIPNVELIALA
jgi:hypothetical protein